MDSRGIKVTVVANAGLVTITPDGWAEPPSSVHLSTIPTLGGTLAFPPDARAGSLPRVLVIDGPTSLLWLDAVYGRPVADAVRDLLDADDGASRTLTAVPEDALLVESLRGLARARWYRDWWPSGDPADPIDAPILDVEALNLDLGTLGWECGMVLESDAEASRELSRGMGALLRLLADDTTQDPALREYLAERRVQSIDAALDLEAGPDELLAVLARVSDDEPLAELPRLASRAPTRSELALAAAPAPSETDAEVRLFSVDWTLTPPRSVSGREHNITLEASTRDAGLRLTVSVEPGQQPVNALVAYVHAGPRDAVIMRRALPLTEAGYAASAVVPMIGLADLDRLSVHVVDASVERPPLPPGGTVPWLVPDRASWAARTREYIRRIVRERLELVSDLAERPLYCEVLAE